MGDKKSNDSRRKLLKSIAAGSGAVVAGKSLPESWSRPVVDSVILPTHAETTTPEICTTNATTGSTSYTSPTNEDFIVPQGVCQINVRVYGAGGASGGRENDNAGDGGYADGNLTVTEGESINVIVASGGSRIGTVGGGVGGSGIAAGGNTASNLNASGGAGGGASGVRQGGVTVIVAGGGGGGGAGTQQSGGNGGNGGGTGQSGGNGSAGAFGGAGAGSASANGEDGGVGLSGGGAGGGGVIGGAGGDAGTEAGAGGGGGSGMAGPDGTTSNGGGGAGGDGIGADGQILISWS